MKIGKCIVCDKSTILGEDDRCINCLTPTHDYEKGFNILMEYFDSISDEEKPEVDRRLKEVGL